VDGLGRIILGECLDLALVALGTLLGQKSLKENVHFYLQKITESPLRTLRRINGTVPYVDSVGYANVYFQYVRRVVLHNETENIFQPVSRNRHRLAK
jgi:hypothetical protein